MTVNSKSIEGRREERNALIATRTYILAWRGVLMLLPISQFEIAFFETWYAKPSQAERLLCLLCWFLRILSLSISGDHNGRRDTLCNSEWMRGLPDNYYATAASPCGVFCTHAYIYIYTYIYIYMSCINITHAHAWSPWRRGPHSTMSRVSVVIVCATVFGNRARYLVTP